MNCIRVQVCPAIFVFNSSRLALNKVVSLLISNAQLGILLLHPLLIIRSFSSGASSNLNEHIYCLISNKYMSMALGCVMIQKDQTILRLLRVYGFTDSHIFKIVKLQTQVLSTHPEKAHLPQNSHFKASVSTFVTLYLGIVFVRHFF